MKPHTPNPNRLNRRPIFLPSASRPLIMVWLVVLLLLPILSGCQQGASIPVDPDPIKAIQKGREIEAGAEKLPFKSADSGTDRQNARNTIYNDAVAYYSAVARRFAGSNTAIEATLAEARVAEDGLKNNQIALNTLKGLLREYPGNPDATERVRALQAKMDAANSTQIPYRFMDGLVHLLGGNPNFSYQIAIVIVALGVTLVVWPLRVRQYKAISNMQRYQPLIAKINERYKDDVQLRQEKIQELYKKHGINPLGCALPLLLQWPVLAGMYQVILQYQFQLGKAHFLWITPSLSAAWSHMHFVAPFTFLNGAVAPNLGEQDFFLLGVYAFSMYLQTKMTPVTDPAQAEQQKVMAVMMPTMFFIMMLQWHLPSAFALYWFSSNAFSAAQQWYIRRSSPKLPPIEEDEDDATAVPVLSRRVSGTGTTPVTAAAGGNGTARKVGATRPMTANKRIVSPKNRRKKG